MSCDYLLAFCTKSYGITSNTTPLDHVLVPPYSVVPY